MKQLSTKQPEQISLANSLRILDATAKEIAERRAEVVGKLLQELKRQGVRQVRLDDGTMYIRAERKSLMVKDPRKARKWADEYDCLQIDKAKALKIFLRLPMPKFFGKTITEYMTVRRYNAQNESAYGEEVES